MPERIQRRGKPHGPNAHLAFALQQLEYIVALDDERHFARAAERCHVTQPTLSMQVQKLEESLGLLIFDRKVHPLQPTAAGAEIILRARRVLAEAKQLQAAVHAMAGWESGTYRVGIIPTLAPSLLPRFLRPFLDQYPDLRLVVEELQTDVIVQRLKEDKLDAGLLAGPLEEAELQERVLLYEPLLVYAAFDHPLSEAQEVVPGRLDPEGLWLLNQGHCLRAQMLNLCALREDQGAQRFGYESGSVDTLMRMVRVNGGYTLVPALAAADAGDGVVTRRFRSPEPAREIVLAAHHSYARKGFLAALEAAVIGSVPEEMRGAEGKERVGFR